MFLISSEKLRGSSNAIFEKIMFLHVCELLRKQGEKKLILEVDVFEGFKSFEFARMTVVEG